MQAAIRHYWLKAFLVSVVAFALGVAVYILVGIVIAHGVSNANAAWHQIAVQPVACSCVVKFAPEQPLPGARTVSDPYITYNSWVPLVVGASGTGEIVIRDQNGVLYNYNKTATPYAEVVAQVELSNGLGMYELTVWFDGVEGLGPDVQSPMFIEYRGLPPAPPNTGGGYLYIGGYAVQAFGVIWTGLVFGAVAFGVFILLAMKRRRQEAEIRRDNLAFGKAMRRQISPKAIDGSGVIAKKSRAKKRKK